MDREFERLSPGDGGEASVSERERMIELLKSGKLDLNPESRQKMMERHSITEDDLQTEENGNGNGFGRAEQQDVENMNPLQMIRHFNQYTSYLKGDYNYLIGCLRDGKDLQEDDVKERKEQINDTLEKFLGSVENPENSLLASKLDPYVHETYFGHDAFSFSESIDAVANSEIRNKKYKGSLEEYLGRLRHLVALWESYRLVMEDLLTREEDVEENEDGSLSAVKVEVRDKGMDRNKNIGALIDALSWMMVSGEEEEGYWESKTQAKVHKKNISFVCPDEEKLKHVKIETPHGIIFNFLINCLNNAFIRSVEAQNITLEVRVEDGEVVFKISNDGKQMPDEWYKPEHKDNPDNIFGRVSHRQSSDLGRADVREGEKAHGKGIGMRFADDRLAVADAKLNVTSTPEQTSFEIRSKIIE